MGLGLGTWTLRYALNNYGSTAYLLVKLPDLPYRRPVYTFSCGIDPKIFLTGETQVLPCPLSLVRAKILTWDGYHLVKTWFELDNQYMILLLLLNLPDKNNYLMGTFTLPLTFRSALSDRHLLSPHVHPVDFQVLNPLWLISDHMQKGTSRSIFICKFSLLLSGFCRGCVTMDHAASCCISKNDSNRKKDHLPTAVFLSESNQIH